MSSTRYGVIAGCLTTAVYLVGSGRAFSLDSAITFANFVATPSLREVFGGRTAIEHSMRSQTGINDHVLVSLLSHIIWMATGSHSEWLYRVLPAVAAGIAVGLVCAFLVRRFGLLAGLTATVFMAADPLWVLNSRELRGYSLMVTFVLLATGLLLRRRMTGLQVIAYGALMALAIASHLMAGIVILIHLTYVAVVQRQRVLTLLPAWAGATAVGLAFNFLAIQNALEVLGGLSKGQFQPDAPKEIVLFLLGAPYPLAVAFWIIMVGVGAITLRHTSWFRAEALMLVSLVAVLWLLVHPTWLFARFFLYLVPAAAYLVAAAIRTRPRLAPLVLVGAAFAIAGQAPIYTSDEYAFRQAAGVIEDAHAAGKRACVFDGDSTVILAYARDFTIVDTSAQLPACDLVVITAWNVEPPLLRAAPPLFPHTRLLRAQINTLVLTK